MDKKLTILLNEETTENYLRFSVKNTESEINEDCMPSGPRLLIEISPLFGDIISIAAGEEWKHLGQASVELA